MPTLENYLGAPVETPQKGVFSMPAASFAWVMRVLFGCHHQRTTRPFDNRQTCLDCGAWRRYRFGFDFERSDAGIDIGLWRAPVRPQRAHRIAAGLLIDNAIAQRHPLTYSDCVIADARISHENWHPDSLDFAGITALTNHIFDRHLARGSWPQCPSCGGDLPGDFCSACGADKGKPVRQ